MSKTTKKRLQKVASIATSAATILWLSGVSMLMPAMAATYSDGTLLKASDSGAVYVVNNNLKVPVRSADVFTSSGYNWSAVKTVSSSALAAVPDASLIKTADNPDVYKLEKNFKRKLASIEIFNSYSLDWAKISTVSQPVMDSFSYAPIFQHNADLFWRDSSNVLHQFTTMEAFTGNGYQTRDLIVANDMEYGSFAIGIVISTVATPETPTPPSTGLAVSLASDTPVAASVPQKSTSVTYLKVNLTAGTAGAATVTNVTVKRTGVGIATDFESVYLYDGASRLTTGRSVNSTTNEATFASLNLSIPAGTTKVLSIVVDMQDTAGSITSGNVNAFQIASASAIGTTATVSGSFPVTGNLMTVAGSASGTLKVEKGANPTAPTVGQTQAIVTEFKLTASTEDAYIKRLSPYQGGSISRTYLTNFKLYQGDTLVSTVSSLNSSDLAVFDLTSSPYTLPKNITRTFTVKADISGSSKNGDTVKFYVDQTTDIFAQGATYGFGMYVDTATNGTFDGSATGTKYTTCTVQGGQITVAVNGPASANVAKGANDHNFMNFSITALSASQIKSLRVEFHAVGGSDFQSGDTTASSNYIADVKVVDTDTNTAVTSAVDASSFTSVTASTAAGIYYAFTDVIDLQAGTTRNFKITADLSSSISESQLYVTLGKTPATSYVFSTTSIKNTENNQYITDIVPSTAVAGQYQTVSSASLVVTISQSPATDNYIKGASSIPSVGFIFTAGTGADIKITSIKVSGYVTDYSSNDLTLYETGSVKITDMVSSITLWDGTTQLGTSESFNTSGNATFDNFTLILTKGTSKTLTVKANSSNSVNLDTVEANVGGFAFDIADLSEDITSVNNDTQSDVDGTADVPNSTTTGGNNMKTIIYLRDTGSLTATADANTPVSALVIAGASSLTFAKVKFTSTYEEFKITKLQVAVPTAASYADNIASVSVSGGGQSEVSKSISTSGTADFSDLSIIVPKDGSTVVTMKASLTTITGGADSGDTVQLEITSTNFEAAGTGSSNTKLTTATNLAAAGSSIGGNDMYVKATVPTVSLTSGWTPAKLTNATHTIYKFTVTNSSPTGGFDISLKKVKFDVAVTDSVVSAGETGVRLNSFYIYRSGESSAISNVSFYDGAGTAAARTVGTNVTGFTSSGYINSTSSQVIMVFNSAGWTSTSSGEETVAAGESKTYEIRATVANVGVGSASNDSVQMRISGANLTNSTVRGLAYAGAVADTNSVLALSDGTSTYAANFIWSDRTVGESTHTSAVDNSATYADADWADGYLIITLPTDYATLTQA